MTTRRTPGLRSGSGSGGAEAAAADEPFAVGTRVVSERWGEGTVQRYDGDQVTVLFDEHGYRELYLQVVRDHGLLHAADGTRPAHLTDYRLGGRLAEGMTRPTAVDLAHVSLWSRRVTSSFDVQRERRSLGALYDL